MKIEIRADGAHISGYVNATEKKSRPVITPRGKGRTEMRDWLKGMRGRLKGMGEAPKGACMRKQTVIK